jgi:DNA-binding transcriptional LysR family regulator
MELRHLRYFATVAEERHFHRAAARLRISQPAISRQIKALEDELGVVLLTRAGAKVGLTPAGESFLAHARDLLKRAANAAEDMKLFRKPAGDKLSVGFTAPTMASTLMPALPRFTAKHPNLDLEFLEVSPQAQIELLRSRRIDMGFIGCACETSHADFEVAVIQKIPLVAVLPDTHPLVAHKSIGLGDLSNDSYVGFSESTQPGWLQALYQVCQAAGFTPAIRYQAESPAAALALVGLGKGVSLMPQEFHHLPHSNAVFVPLRQPAPMFSSSVAFRKEDERQTVTDLIACCREVTSHDIRLAPRAFDSANCHVGGREVALRADPQNTPDDRVPGHGPVGSLRRGRVVSSPRLHRQTP